MFVVLSPAKTLDFDSPLPLLPAHSEPRFLEQSAKLVALMRKQSPADIASLMKVSDKIAHLNAERFALWRDDMSDETQARAAVFAFRGDVYTGLEVDSFATQHLQTAQQRLRILSGLYGLLKPLDHIRPYRLEMGIPLANPKGKNLYQFWGDRLTDQLAADMREQGSELLVNLASLEYFKAIDPKRLPFPVVSPIFEDEKNGHYKIISFYAKKARGLMAAWLIQNGIAEAATLPNFNVAGYRYHAASSTPSQPVFRRPERLAS